MLIPLVVALWQDRDFGSIKRTLIESVENLSDWNFNQRAQAVGVHPGPSFNLWTAFTPTVTFFGEDQGKGSLTLGPNPASRPLTSAAIQRDRSRGRSRRPSSDRSSLRPGTISGRRLRESLSVLGLWSA